MDTYREYKTILTSCIKRMFNIEHYIIIKLENFKRDNAKSIIV